MASIPSNGGVAISNNPPISHQSPISTSQIESMPQPTTQSKILGNISPVANGTPPPIISGIQVDPTQFHHRSPQAKTTIRMVHDRLRRQSYDVRVLNPNGTVSSHSQLRPQRTASARLNPSFTSPSLASNLSIGSLQAKRRHSRVISFGYASAGFYVRRGPDDEEWLEEFEFECERPSTSQSINEDEECCCDLPMPGAISGVGMEEENGGIPVNGASGESSANAISPSPQYRSRPQGHQSNLLQNGHYQKNGNAGGGHSTSSSQQHQPMALFLLRHADHRILPVYCYRPQGIQADQFIQSLSEKNREAIKKFMEKEGPDEGECYLWVRDDVTMKNTVLSLTLLQNHFKSEHIRRVKWRHLSVDKVSVYRYSLPVITTKFRLRVAHFLARHYRCCILGVWCLVILCISIGIVLSVVFGSAPGTQKGNNSTMVPIQAAVQRTGGFMDDAIEMEQAAAQTERPSSQINKPLVMVNGGRIAPPGSLQGIIGHGHMPRLKRRRRKR